MISLYDSTLLDGLPKFFGQQPWARALSKTISKYDRRLMDWLGNIMIYAEPDNLTETACDLLAIEFQTPQYRQEYTVDVKQNMVLHSYEYLSTAGTKYAVERLVSDIFGDAQVEEWFEYGGDPGYFGITTTNPAVTEENVSDFREAAESVKPVSAWLDYVNLLLDGGNGDIYFGGFVIEAETLNIMEKGSG